MDSKGPKKEARRSVWRHFNVLVIGWFCCLVFVICPELPAGQGKPPLPKEDEACLACHSQADLKSEKGRSLFVDPQKHAAGAHAVLGCRDCHTTIKDFPHPATVPKPRCASCHTDPVADLPKSVHAVLGTQACSSCHGDVHDLKAPAQGLSANCAKCHANAVKEFQGSVHGQAAKKGDPDAPACFSCHGPVHKIRVSADPASPVTKRNLVDTCAACHSNREFLSRHRIPVAHPVELYKQSVHAQALAAGKPAAVCSDCHGSHGILAARDSRSQINHWNVAASCAQCHTEIARTYLESIHGQAMKAGVRDAPVCTDCHGEHLILGPKDQASPVSASHVSAATCGRCHGDERLTQRYNLPADRVPSYADSYHGLAMREGSQTVANCASCHGVHNIFPSSDPRSTVHVANLPKTCGNCHIGAGEKFALGPVHVQTAAGPAHPVVKWIRWAYWIVIPLTLSFMIVHNLVDFLSKLIRRRRAEESGDQVVRMNLYFRIAHWGVMLSFPTLVITGFALKYPDAWWSAPLLIWENRVAFRGSVHRAAGVVLIAATIYHVVHLAVSRRDRALLTAMLPRWSDVTGLVHMFRYNLGLSDTEPKFSKFSYAEKLEYWAFLWGTVVMSLSGFLLWFTNFTLRNFPKRVLDAATAIHWYEALLATFSILLWHFYFVIFDPLVYPMDRAWLTGKVPAAHYRHSRPEYLRLCDRAAHRDAVPEPTSAPSGEESLDEPPAKDPRSSA
jgi:formate dehydrogenase gamma subunit